MTNEIDSFLKNNAEVLETGEFALTKNNALKYVNILKKHKKFILGGDVYFKDEFGFKTSYDNWFSQKDAHSTEESVNRAKLYIKNYPKSDLVYFVVIV